MLKTKAAEVYRTIQQTAGLAPGTPIPEQLLQHISTFMNTQDYFEVSNLQRQEVTEDNIFSENDFIHYEQPTDSRSPYTVKMGSLLFKVNPEGKGGFQLQISYIDKTHHTVRPPMFNFLGNRYPYLLFDDLVPFRLGGTETAIARPADNSVLPSAGRLRQIFMDMARNIPVEQNIIQRAMADFFAAKEAYEQTQAQAARAEAAAPTAHVHQPRHQQTLFATLKERDLKDFANPKLKPRNEKELAAKLAMSFYLEFSLDDETIKQIIKEYIDETGTLLNDMNDAWIDTVLSAKIDLERYTLITVFSNLELPPADKLKNAIDQIKQESGYDQEAATSAKS